MVHKSSDHRKLPSICFFTITWKKYERNWLYFPLRKRACVTSEVIFIVCTLIDNSYEPNSGWKF